MLLLIVFFIRIAYNKNTKILTNKMQTNSSVPVTIRLYKNLHKKKMFLFLKLLVTIKEIIMYKNID